MGVLFNAFLHFKMKMWQPLVYSSVSNIIDMWYNPLVQIHLLGKEAEGPLARPFGAASAGALGAAGAAPPPNPFAALAKAKAAAAAAD